MNIQDESPWLLIGVIFPASITGSRLFDCAFCCRLQRLVFSQEVIDKILHKTKCRQERKIMLETKKCKK